MAHYLRFSDSGLEPLTVSDGFPAAASSLAGSTTNWRSASAGTFDSCPATTRRTERPLPTDRDYQRILNRLEHLVSGAVVSLTESKHFELNLDEDDWQFVRVRTHGRPSPMTVLLSPHKGQVVIYLSLSTQEPRRDSYDLCFTRDVVTYAEAGGKLKAPWVFLGIHCVAETMTKLSLRFGKTVRRQHSETHIASLPDLNEFRRDEGKRQALALKVGELLIQRQTAWTLKYAEKDYISDNRHYLLRASNAEKKEAETQRQQAAILKHKQWLRDKKAKALLALRRQELRAEAERQAKYAQERREQLCSQQRRWLKWMYAVAALETMWFKLHKRKSTHELANRRMKAAMVLQRCYKKVILTVNPKRLSRQHALHHLRLYVNLVGLLEFSHINMSLKTAISASTELHNIRICMSKFYCKIKLMQEMWRKYVFVKRKRMHILQQMWDTAVSDLLETAKQTGKRKQLQELKGRLASVDSKSILQEHMLACQRQFYQDISAYVNSNPAVRKGLKSLMRTDEATGAPAFHYLPSSMQTLVQTAVSN